MRALARAPPRSSPPERVATKKRCANALRFVMSGDVLQVQRVLVVDGHADTVEMLEVLLAARGLEVRAASRGHEAIALACQLEPDLAIIELELPDMTGAELARELRRSARRPLFVYAWSTSKRRLRDDAHAFDRSMLKPVDAGTLLRSPA